MDKVGHTIVFDKETHSKIKELARENERSFQKQVYFIVKEWVSQQTERQAR